MSQLTLRFSVVEKNERGQEVELVRKALQFKPQVRSCQVTYKGISNLEYIKYDDS